MKIQSPWMGRVRGSAGNMTGAKVYNKNVMRAKAFEVSNPNTQAQQTERGFFAQLMAAVATLSEDQLRTLYPQKPKTKSRRNMLTTQLSSAFTVDGTTKSLNFGNIAQFGNGAQSRCPLLKMTEHFSNGSFLLNPAWAPDFVANQTSFVLVVFHGATGAITMYDIPPVDPERPEEPEPVEVPEYPEPDPMDYGVCLPTLDNKDHSGDAFGTYAVMSMSKRGGVSPTPVPPIPTPTIPAIKEVTTTDGLTGHQIMVSFFDDLPNGITLGDAVAEGTSEIIVERADWYEYTTNSVSGKLAMSVSDGDKIVISFYEDGSLIDEQTASITVSL